MYQIVGIRIHLRPLLVTFYILIRLRNNKGIGLQVNKEWSVVTQRSLWGNDGLKAFFLIDKGYVSLSFSLLLFYFFLSADVHYEFNLVSY